MKIKNLFQTAFSALTNTVKRFPLASVYVVVGFFSALILVNEGPLYYVEVWATKLVLVLLTVIPLTVAVSLLAEYKKLAGRYLVAANLGIVVFTGLMVYLLPANQYGNVTPSAYWWWLLAIGIISWLAPTVVVMGKNKESETYWQFGFLSLIYLIFAAGVGILAFMGLGMAITGLNVITDVFYLDYLYQNAFVFAAALLAPFVFLQSIPQLKSVKGLDYPDIVRYLVIYICLPIVAIYLLIAYLPILSFGAIQLIPRIEYVSILLTFLVIGLFVMLVFWPLAKSKTQWARKVWSGYFIATLPLILFGFYKHMQQIDVEGLTLNNYWQLALLIALAIISIIAIRNREQHLRYIPLAVILLMGVYLASMIPITKSSLTNRMLDAAMTANMVNEYRQLIPYDDQSTAKLTAEANRNLQTAIGSLVDDYGVEYVAAFVSPDLNLDQSVDSYMYQFNLLPALNLPPQEEGMIASFRRTPAVRLYNQEFWYGTEGISIAGFNKLRRVDLFCDYNYTGDCQYAQPGIDFAGSLNTEMRYKFAENGQVLEFDFKPVLTELYENRNDVNRDFSFQPDVTDGQAYRLFIESVEFDYNEETDQFSVDYLSGVLLY